MGLPGVEIPILNGQLGRVEPSEDAVMGLVLSGVATDDVALTTPKQIFTLKEAEDLGINEAYDTTNTTDAWKQIKDYYAQAGNGAELWFMIIAKTTTMAGACDKDNDIVKKLLNTAQGRITMWAISRVPDGDYVTVTTNGIDTDVEAAVLKAHALCEEFAAQHKPCRFLIGARAFTGTPSALKNFRQNTNNRGGVVLGSTFSTGQPAVGFVLGRFANRPVQRKISRVKDGDVGLLNAYMSNGTATETYESAWNSIHDKGYIFFRKFANKSGYYINSDPACCPVSDDYSSLARGRVIDKAHRIAYATFVNEIEDDLEVDGQGYLSPAVAKGYQAKIIRAINANMKDNGKDEISDVICIIDPKQNLLATDTVAIEKLGVRPKGYATFITIPLGFDNPLNS